MPGSARTSVRDADAGLNLGNWNTEGLLASAGLPVTAEKLREFSELI